MNLHPHIVHNLPYHHPAAAPAAAFRIFGRRGAVHPSAGDYEFVQFSRRGEQSRG